MPRHGTLSQPPAKPTLIYDGECRFCCRWIKRWQSVTGDKLTYVTSQDNGSVEGIDDAIYKTSVVYIDGRGDWFSGAQAVLKSLHDATGSFWYKVYKKIRWFASMSEFLYAKVAGNRYTFSRVERFLFGSYEPERSYQTAARFGSMGLGLVYAIAFASLLPQLKGLIGSNGILPIADAVQNSGVTAVEGWKLFPTLAWFNSSDVFLVLQCLAGIAAGIAAFLGVFVWPAMALAWLLYLSLSVAGRVFFGFQWDILLLEMGFLSLLTCRPGFKGIFARWKVSRLAVFLHHFLLFRLIFASGLVKLLSGDETWSGLKAMDYHYWTQPLPTAAAYFADKLPHWFDAASTAAVLFIELVIPFFIFLGLRFKKAAFFAFSFLMAVIAVTGNYCFFNLLTVILCFWLLPDSVWPQKLRIQRLKETMFTFRGVLWRWTSFIFVAVAFFGASVAFGAQIGVGQYFPKIMRETAALVQPFRLANNYGLFAVMTKSRNEIVIEGSYDGENWQEYEFKYKPQDIMRAPAWCAPHQPRLDWQMWFAALGSYKNSPWYRLLLIRLFENDAEVSKLFKHNPFAGKVPPKYIRSRLYSYAFSSLSDLRQGKGWWKRIDQGLYAPTVSRT